MRYCARLGVALKVAGDTDVPRTARLVFAELKLDAQDWIEKIGCTVAQQRYRCRVLGIDREIEGAALVQPGRLAGR